MFDRQKVIDIALAEVGYLEKATNAQLDDKTANAGRNNFTKYARDLDAIPEIYNGRKQGYAWCDVFVDWCFVQAYGVEAMQTLLRQPDESLGAGCGYSARYFRNKGQFHTSNPQVGDQIFFGTSGNESHTGLVYKVDASRVYTVEGNTSGASGVIANGGGVCKKSYTLGYRGISGYGRPAYGDSVPEPVVDPYPTLRKGDSGDAVKTLQNRLITHGYSLPIYGADGDFGNETDRVLRTFQLANGLEVDGICGPKTWEALNAVPVPDAEYPLEQFIRDIQAACGAKVDGIAGPETLSKTVTLSAHINNKHPAVKPVQQRLAVLKYAEVGAADGEAGPKFTSAVAHYQMDNGCEVDGEITAKNKTWKKLLGMA